MQSFCQPNSPFIICDKREKNTNGAAFRGGFYCHLHTHKLKLCSSCSVWTYSGRCSRNSHVQYDHSLLLVRCLWRGDTDTLTTSVICVVNLLLYIICNTNFYICFKLPLCAGSLISAGHVFTATYCPTANNDVHTQCGSIQTRLLHITYVWMWEHDLHPARQTAGAQIS